MCIIAIIVTMAVACLASIAILVGSMAALYGWIGTEVKEDKIEG